MVVKLELNDHVIEHYEGEAEAQDLSLEELLAGILTTSAYVPVASTFLSMTPEAVMAEVRTLPPNPNAVIPAQGSLLEALLAGPEDPDFDLDVWNQQWAQVEAEMKAITSQNDWQEGRR